MQNTIFSIITASEDNRHRIPSGLNGRCDHISAALAPYVVTTSTLEAPTAITTLVPRLHHKHPARLRAQASMASSSGDNEHSVCSSRLLQLPRELRELIYEHAIVRATIPIECAVIRGPGYRKHTGYPCATSPQLCEAYPLYREVAHRRTWSLPIYDLNVDIQGGTWLEPKRAQMTYQLAIPCPRPDHAHRNDDIAIHLLQVCRTIYDEARPLFYKKNTFIPPLRQPC